jgi:antitoxin VapB
MSLNIKDERTHNLARQVAQKTGETLKEAVTVALQERLDRLQDEDGTEKMFAALLEISRQGAAMFPGPHIDHAELLYDENGLPK